MIIITPPKNLPLLAGCRNTWRLGDGAIGLRTTPYLDLKFTEWAAECNTVASGLDITAMGTGYAAYALRIAFSPTGGMFGQKAQWWISIQHRVISKVHS